EFINALDRLGKSTIVQPDTALRYAASSMFLRDCQRFLTRDDKEQFVYITGPVIDHVNVLDHILELEHERRTAGGVTPLLRFTHDLLIRLEQHEHKLLAHAHSHPWNGAEATRPSPTDQRFQQRLESGGHSAVA